MRNSSAALVLCSAALLCLFGIFMVLLRTYMNSEIELDWWLLIDAASYAMVYGPAAIAILAGVLGVSVYFTCRSQNARLDRIEEIIGQMKDCQKNS